MKLNKSILAAGAALMLMTSCSDWLDVNNDPNTATDAAAPYDKRLAHIEFYTNHAYYIGGQPIAYLTGDITQNSRTNNQGCFAQWTMTEWRSTTVYQWWFVGAACNIKPMIDDAMAHGAYHYAGVGHLLLAYGMTMMNDLHGEMPCYDALGTNVTPVYSNGKEMYRYIMEQIEQGLELLAREQAPGASSLAANDYWGGGDVSKWVKFGNLMKARQILKLTKKGAGTFNLENESFVYDADAILAALDKSYKSNAESMVINHTDQPDGSTDNLWGEQVYYGPLYSCVGMNSNIYFTKTVEDNLTHFAGATIEDPRANHILPWAKSGITPGKTPAGLTWDETETWRRTKGLDMQSNVRISGSPYSTFWGVPEGDPNKAPHFYCNSKDNSGDTVYVQQRCGGTGNYGGTDLLIYLDNQQGRGGDASAMSGTFMTRPSSPGPVGTYYEVCFIRAEVLFNKGDKAGALAAYKEGVKAHMEFMKAKIDQWLAEDSKLARCPSFKPMTNEEIDNYVNSNKGLCKGDLTLGKIMTQKHIAMMFTQENWNDMRRYDYNPNVFLAWNKPYEYGVSSKTTIPEGQYPRRWKVSSHEYRYNTANLDAACPTDLCNLVGASTGKNWWNAPSMWVIPVWWDSNLK